MKKKNYILIDEFLSDLIKGIFAGIMIGIGGVVFIALENKIVGSFLFSLGLLTICIKGYNLYTGKIGYIVFEKINYLLLLLATLIGNFIGTNVVGVLIRNTRFDSYIEVANNLAKVKLGDSLASIFILSVFCGILMFLAVDSFKKGKDIYSKYIPIHLCVMVFILCGFEHCVANMVYFSIAGIYSLKMFLYLFVMVLGNSVGSIVFALNAKVLKDK